MNRADNEIFDRVVERLFRLRKACGSAVFQDAANRALVAIARSVLDEAERRAAAGKAPRAVILKFPERNRDRGDVVT